VTIVSGIGVDIISISSLKDAVDTAGRVFLDYVFTRWEQQCAETRDNPIAYLAMIFAGKEAIFKAFKIHWDTGVRLTEIEVKEGIFGEPVPALTGKFAQLASQLDTVSVLLSLSYDGEYAMAIATLVTGEASNPSAV
jgi:holo-[acyl-carrier protein] synthase